MPSSSRSTRSSGKKVSHQASKQPSKAPKQSMSKVAKKPTQGADSSKKMKKGSNSLAIKENKSAGQSIGG